MSASPPYLLLDKVMNMKQHVHAFGASLSVAAGLTALIFAVKALFPEFEEWGEEAFGHAWLYMGILGLAVFLSLGLVRFRLTTGSIKLATMIAVTTVASGAVILLAAAVLALTG